MCCPPGSVRHEKNPAACRLCPPGSIAPGAGSTKCDKCSEGFTTPKKSRTACSVCLPGRAGPTCQKCSPGTWSAGGDPSSTVCTSCPAGTHSVMAGSTTHKDCKPRSMKPADLPKRAAPSGTCKGNPEA
uniref:Laminin EGF-like domain-containing protein n=1 Tax=Tetradesmus obliquus TaxID=3088 RepID=A0A383V429_TETOB|eukprot:jgi/Sobl393_1/10060/SZX59703.1